MENHWRFYEPAIQMFGNPTYGGHDDSEYSSAKMAQITTKTIKPAISQ